MEPGASAARRRPQPPPDAATLAQVVTRLPMAVVLVDAQGQPRWHNDVVDALTRDSTEGLDRLLDAIAAALTTIDGPVTTVALPTPRGLLERELWATGITPELRAVSFQPDVQAVPGGSAADEHIQRLEAMLAHTDDIITLLNGDGTIRASNVAAGRLTGFAGESVNGRNAFDFVHPDDVSQAATALEAAMAEPLATSRAVVRIRFADDTWHDVEASVANLLDDPSVASLVISLHDVTDRVRAERQVAKSEAQLRSLVENLTDVIVVLDERFEIVYATPGIEHIIDAPAATNMGMSALNDVHPDDLERVVEVLGGLATAPLGETARVELRLEARPGSGRWRWIEATAVNRLDDPDVQGIVCTLRDVSESKAAAEELRAAFDRLRELDTLKDQFLASVSHEMRTPLAIIIGFADLLEHGDDLDASVRAEALDRVRASAAEMRAMVENLLDFSALEAGKLSIVLEPVRIVTAVGSAVTTVRALLADHVVEVDVPDDLEASADHEALDRILRNLLANAAKYSDPGRTIRVTGRRDHDDDGGGVRVEVGDEGVGIAPDQQALVFERLYRGPGAAFVSRGTGVGLNMVKRYAELMGGSVSVRSTVGEGSTFTVHLAGTT